MRSSNASRGRLLEPPRSRPSILLRSQPPSPPSAGAADAALRLLTFFITPALLLFPLFNYPSGWFKATG
jgi:hypothetical protein